MNERTTVAGVSVIIPNYNHAPYLRERIESVLAQTYRDFEVILLDDCSTDASPEIINHYRDHEKVSHVVLNTENSGTTFKQWARGIELARYDWIWIAESDDWCEPTLLQNLVAGIGDATCISYCQSIIVRENAVLPAPETPHFYKVYGGDEFISRLMLEYPALYNASMAIFKKSCYYQLDKKFTEFRFCGDWLFWILVARQGEVVVSGKRLNYFRKHGADVSGRAQKEGLLYSEYIKLLDELRAIGLLNEARRTELLLMKFNHFLLITASLDAEVVAGIKRKYYLALGHPLNYKQVFSLLGKKNTLKVVRDKLYEITR